MSRVTWLLLIGKNVCLVHMFTHEIVIVGAGPAGSAAALELANLDPGLAERLLLLDKAVFPRPKHCAGGLSVDTDSELRGLGVEIESFE